MRFAFRATAVTFAAALAPAQARAGIGEGGMNPLPCFCCLLAGPLVLTALLVASFYALKPPRDPENAHDDS